MYHCFGRTISGYDPQTLLYATSANHDNANGCNNRTDDNNAICLTGQNSGIFGDVFAMSPNGPGDFPPPNPPTPTGGTIYMSGGDASAGFGFLQSWWFTVQGNGGSYSGTGPIGPSSCDFSGTGQTITNPDQYVPAGCVIQGDPKQVIIGADLSMDE